MGKLSDKIKKAKKILRQTHKRFSPEKTLLAWTGGKDSTVVLALAREEFNGKVPWKIFFNDSKMEFPEVYDFIDEISGKWDLTVLSVHDAQGFANLKQAKTQEKKQHWSRLMKVRAINQALKEYGIKAFIAGIRHDEHPARSREEAFSKRANHYRVHPILEFTEKDIWDYIKSNNVPYVNLYDKGYRSLGEMPFTKPVRSKNAKERSGREYDKEQIMAQLRAIGYW